MINIYLLDTINFYFLLNTVYVFNYMKTYCVSKIIALRETITKGVNISHIFPDMIRNLSSVSRLKY